MGSDSIVHVQMSGALRAFRCSAGVGEVNGNNLNNMEQLFIAGQLARVMKGFPLDLVGTEFLISTISCYMLFMLFSSDGGPWGMRPTPAPQRLCVK